MIEFLEYLADVFIAAVILLLFVAYLMFRNQ